MTTAPIIENPAPKKRGRPRKHASNAAKQRAYNKRKQDPERKALIAKILKSRRGPEHESLMRLSIRELKRWKRAVGTGRGRRIS